MKATIYEFRQDLAIKYKCDVVDLTLLSYLHYAQTSSRLIRIQIESKSYFWLTPQKILDDLPILDFTERGLWNRINKLVEKGLLEKTSKCDDGTKFKRTYYRTTDLTYDMTEYNQEKIITPPSPPKTKTKNNSNNNDDKFVKPTLEEVEAYCRERNNNINAEQFIAFYDSNGWKVGKNPMKSWKSAIITWEGRNKDKQKQSQSTFNKVYKKEDYEGCDF